MSVDQFKQQRVLDDEAVYCPQIGDTWWEMSVMYFIVVAINLSNGNYTVLSCFSDDDVMKAKVENRDGTWSFDYSKHSLVTKDWISKTVHYTALPSQFVAHVRRSESNMRVVNEWREFHFGKKVIEENPREKRLKELLKELKDDYGIDANSSVEMSKVWQDSW
jgi:hypothetical protein